MHIGNILNSLLAHHDNWKNQVIKEWPTIIGDLHKHVCLEKFLPDNTLVIGVYDSSWMQELYLLTPMLVKRINQHLGATKITGIRLKYCPEKITTLNTPEVKVIKKKQVELSTREKQALAKIEDPELQQALHNFLVRCYQEK